MTLDRDARVRLLARGGLGGGDELLAPAELLQQALGAARRRLRELAGAGVEQPARRRHGDAAESLGKRIEGVDDPDANEQPLRERRDLPLGAHKLREL